MKFEIGDLITAVPEASYSYTTSDSVCKVIDGDGFGYLLVEIVEQTRHPSEVGSQYDVYEGDFELVNPYTLVISENYNI